MDLSFHRVSFRNCLQLQFQFIILANEFLIDTTKLFHLQGQLFVLVGDLLSQPFQLFQMK